jgi:heat shock protein HtpX
MGAIGATLRTMLLFGVMIGLFMVVGWLVGTYFIGNWLLGLIIFIGFAALINAVSYFFSSKIVLWSYKAKIVTMNDSPRLYRTVKSIADRSGMPMPQIAIIPTTMPNAFATGRNPKNATVAATEGIMRLLDDDELQGVLAHEMAHVKDRDILVMSIAATVAGAISFAARWAFYGSLFSGGNNRDNGGFIIMLAVAITAPIAAMMVQLAISRGREYKADYEGAKLIGRPLYLARALRKLEAGVKRDPIKFGNPASSGLWIVNPFAASGLVRIFSTHPPMDERIRRLEKQAHDMGQY